VAAVDASIPSRGIHVESTFPGDVRVVNDGDAVARIMWSMPMEREEAGVWTPAHSMTLMQSCEKPPPASMCVEIAPHTTYATLPWTGWFGCTQCGICRANAPARPGRYRAVAVECDGGPRHEGPPMTIVDEGRLAKTPHVHGASDNPSVIEIDNEADEPVSFRLAVDVAKLDASRGAWETVEKTGMTLSSSCFPDAGAPACVTLAPHETLRSMPLRPGCAPCSKCAIQSIKPGAYMLTTQLCEGSKPFYNAYSGYTFRTKPFTVASNGSVTAEKL
jgi:hypothetical protein